MLGNFQRQVPCFEWARAGCACSRCGTACLDFVLILFSKADKTEIFRKSVRSQKINLPTKDNHTTGTCNPNFDLILKIYILSHSVLF